VSLLCRIGPIDENLIVNRAPERSGHLTPVSSKGAATDRSRREPFISQRMLKIRPLENGLIWLIPTVDLEADDLYLMKVVDP
jgi:hypothetical protein